MPENRIQFRKAVPVTAVQVVRARLVGTDGAVPSGAGGCGGQSNPSRQPAAWELGGTALEVAAPCPNLTYQLRGEHVCAILFPFYVGVEPSAGNPEGAAPLT